MIQDLHSHTYYSFCGGDNPEDVVKAAIDGGIKLLGITDHNHGIINGTVHNFYEAPADFTCVAERTLKRYYDHIDLVRQKYADKITVLRGIELCTMNRPRHFLPDDADISYYDYCLIENIDDSNTVTNNDLFAYADRCKCKCGIAHTDMFAFIERMGYDPLEYFHKMAEKGIFWEMNVNLDTIHKGRVHEYMLKFFEDKEQQRIVRESGVEISVGFDGHRIVDYKPWRVAEYCKKIEDMGIKMPFEQ